MIRLVPNSCTSPVSTLKGWPASATSSPMRNTRGSRRISSAIASRTASPYVSSRAATSGVDILIHLVRLGVWRRQGELRSEEHTSELQSQSNLVCRLLLEKKKKIKRKNTCRLMHKNNR